MRLAPWIGFALLALALPAAAQDVNSGSSLDGGISDTEICDNCNPAIVDFDAWGVGPQERPDAGARQRRARPDAGAEPPSDAGGFGCSSLGFVGLEAMLLLALLRRRERD